MPLHICFNHKSVHTISNDLLALYWAQYYSLVDTPKSAALIGDTIVKALLYRTEIFVPEAAIAELGKNPEVFLQERFKYWWKSLPNHHLKYFSSRISFAQLIQSADYFLVKKFIPEALQRNFILSFKGDRTDRSEIQGYVEDLGLYFDEE